MQPRNPASSWLEGSSTATARGQYRWGDVGTAWPNNTLSYSMTPQTAIGTVVALEGGLGLWQRSLQGCVNFHQTMSTQTWRVMYSHSSNKCSSPMGYHGSRSHTTNRFAQPLTLTPQCHAGSAAHAIGHALGLGHEHSRSDRDTYLRVWPEHVEPVSRRTQAWRDEQFAKESPQPPPTDSYQPQSIMHFGWNWLAKPTLLHPKDFTMTSTAATQSARDAWYKLVGQRHRLHSADVRRVRAIYNCPARVPGKLPPGAVCLEDEQCQNKCETNVCS